MKARKHKTKKNDRGCEIPNDYQDCARIDSEEDNEDWRKGSAKEVSKLTEYEFVDFYPKDWTPPKGCEFCSLRRHHELKQDLRNKCRMEAGSKRLDASGRSTTSSMIKNSSVKLLLLIATANILKVEGGDIENSYLNAKCGEKCGQ